jgi:hypothetical protein
MRPVTERAIQRRINRVLAKQGQRLCRSRPGRAESDLGGYYIIDVYQNVVLATHVDLDQLARELGCMLETEVAREAA